MPAAPTVILTTSQRAGQGKAVGMFEHLADFAHTLMACHMPVVLVTADPHTPAWPLSSPVAHCTVCTIAPQALNPLDQHVEALIEGVLLSAHSPGWVWVPTDTPMLKRQTVLDVAEQLRGASLSHAEHNQRAGIPLGIGAELYSEIIHLSGHADLLRLRARYPAQAVPSSDPGVLMSEVGRMEPTLPLVNTAQFAPRFLR